MIRGLLAAAVIWAAPVTAQEAWHAEVLALAENLGHAFRAEAGIDWLMPRTHPAIRTLSAQEFGLAPDDMDQRVRAGYALSATMLDMLVHQPVPDRVVFGSNAQGLRWGMVPFRVQAQRKGEAALPETCSLFLFFTAGDGWFVHGIGKLKTEASLAEALPDLAAALPTDRPDCANPTS